MSVSSESASTQCAISIVIVSWNTRDILQDCLESIANQTTLPHEVIVVDNASTDGSQDMIRQSFPDVTLIANTDNRGFAAANNQGLEIAKGDKLLLLNPDTIVLDHAIDVMSGWLDAHPDVGCVGCQVFEDADTIQRTCFADPGPLNLALIEFGLYRLAPRHPLLGCPEYGDWNRDSERDVDVVSGMFMLVPRHVFEAVGLLDEAFFVYSEEADWCRRIRDAGWRCVFSPEARILHLEGGSKSTAQIKSRMYVQKQKSKMIYTRKHYGWFGALCAKSAFLCSAILRGGAFGLANLARSTPNHKAKVRLARDVIRFHLFGREPAA
ncbi:glycosyltransferase family 2 protein [Ruegeria meonggei]|uniref:N-acetylglucosaminyl-diphospho-decaprenol L-rhamnosyltransferase n=1 Tax=Ruegeria meonggei TaxID=1446476 RepID=A0A1X7ACY7_9RHOB|nr:glycosyltransferase family 2 protein [Ruegeria meonggei]SLN76053.1 N-acetylglucosaminyl-diphospho-decaprenol L-rhamnosyltransferase [Ruegeria meonggei]